MIGFLSWADQQPIIPAHAAIFGKIVRSGRVRLEKMKLIFTDREVRFPFGCTVHAGDRSSEIISTGAAIDTKTEPVLAADELVLELPYHSVFELLAGSAIGQALGNNALTRPASPQVNWRAISGDTANQASLYMKAL